jgi:hypothetical protein
MAERFFLSGGEERGEVGYILGEVTLGDGLFEGLRGSPEDYCVSFGLVHKTAETEDKDWETVASFWSEDQLKSAPDGPKLCGPGVTVTAPLRTTPN